MPYGAGNGPGRPRGTSKYPYADEQEDAKVVAYIQTGLDNTEIAARMGWADPTIVRDIRARYFPTTGLAAAILQAGAARLAQRVIDEADVDEALDVLSRPNIGVLKPLAKGEGKAAFLTSVQVESLGGVRVSTAVVTGEGASEYPVPVPPSPSDERQRIREAAPALAPVFDVIDRVVDDVMTDAKPAISAAVKQVGKGRTTPVLVPVPPVRTAKPTPKAKAKPKAKPKPVRRTRTPR